HAEQQREGGTEDRPEGKQTHVPGHDFLLQRLRSQRRDSCGASSADEKRGRRPGSSSERRLASVSRRSVRRVTTVEAASVSKAFSLTLRRSPGASVGSTLPIA